VAARAPFCIEGERKTAEHQERRDDGPTAMQRDGDHEDRRGDPRPADRDASPHVEPRLQSVTITTPAAFTVHMFLLWRLLGFRRLLALFVLRKVWRMLRARRRGYRSARSTGVDASA
jgi:hypothetical protein